MEKVILNADIREGLGKGPNKRLRSTRAIPAVVYRKGHKSLPLKIDGKELFHALHTSAGENAIITLKIKSDEKTDKSEKDKTVIIKEIQHDPIKGDILHIDFHEISLTEKIAVDVPIEVKGEPQGVKADGGVLDNPIKEVRVECLPTDIPKSIEVHVVELKIGDAIRVKDLKIPAGVKVLIDPELTVVSVVPPHVEEVKVEAAEGEITEPEVIREKKPEAGEEAEEAQPEGKEAKGKEAKKE